MTRKYLGDLEQDNEVVDEGTYSCEVVDARSAETSSGGNMLWLDLKILGGPDDGRTVSVSVNLPHEGEKGVLFAKRKLRAFAGPIKAAKIEQMPDEEQTDAIAAVVRGAQIEARLSIQAQGQYKGSQQLEETMAPAEPGTPARVPAASNTEPPF